MKNPAEKALFDFLNVQWIPGRRLLLGLSGGPDSLALLYLLIQYVNTNAYELPLELAHIDHGWREESTDEAEKLANLAKELNLPFHLKTLNPTFLKGNLENACRVERLKFFKELSDDLGCCALLLGHHADDQAETVLKRLFEGANLFSLEGLQSVTYWEGMCIWRPFLSVRKKYILKWLDDHQKIPFEDSTNLDSKFMRGRMRTQLLPYLSDVFGKEVSPALCRIGEEAAEFHDYLVQRLTPYLELVLRSSSGALLDFNQNGPSCKFEIKQLIRFLFKSEGITHSKSELESVSEWIFSEKANQNMICGATAMNVDRKRLFIWSELGAACDFHFIPVSVDSFCYGHWRVTISKEHDPSAIKAQKKGWQQVWKGYLEVYLPQGDYVLGPAKNQAKYIKGGSLDDWWTDHKIPACLRHQVPVIWAGDFIAEEFLVENSNTYSEKHLGEWLKIVLEVI